MSYTKRFLERFDNDLDHANEALESGQFAPGFDEEGNPIDGSESFERRVLKQERPNGVWDVPLVEEGGDD